MLQTGQAVPPPGQAASGAPVDGRSVRWEAHREERRRELIQAARRAIHHLGFDASMEDIAANAGTSKSVFYRYFGDKAGLRQAVGKVVIGQMQDTIMAAGRTPMLRPKAAVAAVARGDRSAERLIQRAPARACGPIIGE